MNLRSHHPFIPGDRVLIMAWSLRGRTGTLLRRTRLPWNGRRGWVVDLDIPGPLGKRQRIAESLLLPAPNQGEGAT